MTRIRHETGYVLSVSPDRYMTLQIQSARPPRQSVDVEWELLEEGVEYQIDDQCDVEIDETNNNSVLSVHCLRRPTRHVLDGRVDNIRTAYGYNNMSQRKTVVDVKITDVGSILSWMPKLSESHVYRCSFGGKLYEQNSHWLKAGQQISLIAVPNSQFYPDQDPIGRDQGLAPVSDQPLGSLWFVRALARSRGELQDVPLYRAMRTTGYRTFENERGRILSIDIRNDEWFIVRTKYHEVKVPYAVWEPKQIYTEDDEVYVSYTVKSRGAQEDVEATDVRFVETPKRYHVILKITAVHSDSYAFGKIMSRLSLEDDVSHDVRIPREAVFGEFNFLSEGAKCMAVVIPALPHEAEEDWVARRCTLEEQPELFDDLELASTKRFIPERQSRERNPASAEPGPSSMLRGRSASRQRPRSSRSQSRVRFQMCQRCPSKPPTHTLLPCRHLELCKECAQKAIKNNEACPKCRQEYEKYVPLH